MFHGSGTVGHKFQFSTSGVNEIVGIPLTQHTDSDISFSIVRLAYEECVLAETPKLLEWLYHDKLKGIK